MFSWICAIRLSNSAGFGKFCVAALMAITRGQAFKQDTARWTGAVLILLGSGIVVEVTRRAFSVGVALKVRRRMRTASCTYRPRSFVSKERKRLSKVSYLALLIIMSWYQFTRSLHGSRTLFSPDTNVRVPRNAVRAETLGRNAVGRRRREYQWPEHRLPSRTGVHRADFGGSRTGFDASQSKPRSIQLICAPVQDDQGAPEPTCSTLQSNRPTGTSG